MCESSGGAQSEPMRYIDNPKRYTEGHTGVHQPPQQPHGLFDKPQQDSDGSRNRAARAESPQPTLGASRSAQPESSPGDDDDVLTGAVKPQGLFGGGTAESEVDYRPDEQTGVTEVEQDEAPVVAAQEVMVTVLQELAEKMQAAQSANDHGCTVPDGFPAGAQGIRLAFVAGRVSVSHTLCRACGGPLF